jgi:hypothetical protein
MGEYGWVKGGKAVPKYHLLIYPGEQSAKGKCKDRAGKVFDCEKWQGTIRVMSGKEEIEAFRMMGGPKDKRKDGNHTAGPTPAGEYRLGAAENRISPSWSSSCVPWGAQLSRGDPSHPGKDPDEYYYLLASTFEPPPASPGWKPLTGPHGVFTQAIIKDLKDDKQTVPALGTPEWTALNDDIKAMLVYEKWEAKALDDPTLEGRPLTTWIRNDFGMWAFNLRQKKGDKWTRSVYYIHTTPPNELQTLAGHGDTTPLAESHGCIHIQPRARIKAMALGYFSRGMKVEIKAYGEKGPPPKIK